MYSNNYFFSLKKKLAKGIMYVFFFLSSLNLTGQNLNYTAIQDKSLFMNLREKDGYLSDIVRECNVDKKVIPKITFTPILLSNFFPHCWKIYNSQIVLIEGFGRSPFSSVLSIKNFPMEKRDSISAAKYYDSLRVEFQRNYPNPEEFQKATRQRLFKEAEKIQEHNFAPASDILRGYIGQPFPNVRFKGNKLIESFSYDFIPVNHKLFMFYLRTDDEFTVWRFHYPPRGEESEATNWEEVITYSSDSIYSPPAKRRDSDVLPSGEKHVFKAIQDTSFFRGHFKAIMQEKHLFLINIAHGGIYVVSDKSIDKIGQLKNLESYPTWIFNKKVFIEDKDNKRLIFFTEVEQLRKDLPFPDVFIIKEEQAFKKYFPYIP
ncbi:MAG TPA: hypothetical protein PKC76_15215 [Saprospiraceae bacterium]|nr:hypothetical protein [Saprospiraceae bacterium]HMP25484.1 hypothetical protein [Saprospiraceae bacterium]